MVLASTAQALLCCTSSVLKELACVLQLGKDYAPCHGALTSRECRPGLTQSHLKAWKRIVDSGASSAWIFECVVLTTIIVN